MSENKASFFLPVEQLNEIHCGLLTSLSLVRFCQHFVNETKAFYQIKGLSFFSIQFSVEKKSYL